MNVLTCSVRVLRVTTLLMGATIVTTLGVKTHTIMFTTATIVMFTVM